MAPPVVPSAGQGGHGVPTGAGIAQMPFLPCRASSDSLLILRQSGGKRAGTSVEVGLFSGKTKAAWPVPKPRGCSGLEELTEDGGPKFGVASVALQRGPNSKPGQPHHPHGRGCLCHLALWCDTGGTSCALWVPTGGSSKSYHNRTREIQKKSKIQLSTRKHCWELETTSHLWQEGHSPAHPSPCFR